MAEEKKSNGAQQKAQVHASIESRIRARAKRERIQDAILRSLFATAAIGLAMAAPNSVQLLRYVKTYVGDKPRLNRRISQAMGRLHARGLVAKDEKGIFRLTKRGEHLATTLETIDQRSKEPPRWDGKWRIVIFDIWERRRAARDKLRGILERNDFVKIQNSVWVYPYECEELFAFVRTHLSLGKGILYIVAEEMENDTQLRRAFDLPHAK